VSIVLFLGVMILLRSGGSPRLKDADSPLIVTVSRGDLDITVTDFGRIDPREKIAIKSKVAGQIARVLVEEGMSVKKGQLLLELEPEEFERSLARAREEVHKARVELELAKAIFDRRRLAVTERGVALSEVDTAKSEFLTRRIALKEARELQRSSEDQLRYSHIVSPIDGVVLQRNIRVGESVVPGSMATLDDRALLIIADLSALVIHSDLNQIDVAKVRLKQDVIVTLDSLPSINYHAKVTKIAPSSIVIQGKDLEVFPIEATLLGSSFTDIKPGMTADLNIHIDTKKGVLKLPIEAVTKQHGHAYVNLVKQGTSKGEQPVVDRVEVQTGARNDRELEIRSGLEQGAQVLIKPPTSEANEYD
jgi:RND family efflux transporter MFP subunit